MKTQALTGLLLTTMLARPAAAQWRLEAWFGDAKNAPSTVTFHQSGEPDLKIDGEWSSRPWRPTWYYSGRIAKWNGGSGWAFQYMHHKVYLDNPTADVAAFRITNGVNILLAERMMSRDGWEFGIGAGPIFAVPISNVRGVSHGGANGIFHSRYELGGATLEGGVARRLKLIPYTYGTLSMKGTVSKLHVSIANGHADMMNYALHFQYGLSLQSKR